MFPLEINVNVYEINFHLVLTHYFMVPQVQCHSPWTTTHFWVLWCLSTSKPVIRWLRGRLWMEDIWLYYFFCTFDLSLTYYLVISNFYGVFLMLVETAVIWSLCLRPNRHDLTLSIIAKFSLPSEYVGHIQTLCGALLCPSKFLNWEILQSC